jgi:dUTPase
MLPQYKFALVKDVNGDKQFLPTQGEPFATGYDVRAAMPDKKSLIISPFARLLIPLGFRALCPDGWWFELKPRSSTFAKKNLHSLIGTIDQCFEGQVMFACQYIPQFKLNQISIEGGHRYAVSFDTTMFETLEIKYGDAIGQIIPVKRQEMEVIEATNEEIENAFKARAASRGAGGFGSTSG